jgi:spermidine/putrescine ABC transporter ATP-binding subunit
MGQLAVELRDIVKRYGAVVALDHVTLNVEEGQFVSLLGPSGCGKTTTLRVIAGFVEPEEGEILVRGEEISTCPPHKRDMGMVYQNYALFPHMTVFENVAYGLRMRGFCKSDIRDRVISVLDLVQLTGMGKRYPGQLSGGQQQRVALARAIAIRPKVLLLDEPLSNLDAKLRKQMQVELRDLQRRLGITTVYVTHDQEEALTLSDRIVVMHHGRIVQVGDPSTIYHHPANTFVANFIGTTNILRGRLSEEDSTRGRLLFISTGGLCLELPWTPTGPRSGEVCVSIRPEEIRFISMTEDGSRSNVAHGVVTHVAYLGNRTSYYVDLASHDRLIIDAPNTAGISIRPVGDKVTCQLPPEAFRVMPVEQT